MRSGLKWPMIGPRPCDYACASVDPVFTSQSYDISISTTTGRTNLSVFLVLILMLISTQVSLAYICACAYAYAYALLKTRLQAFIYLFLRRTTLKRTLAASSKLVCAGKHLSY